MDYSIRRSDRARRVRVTVDADARVVVVLPRRAPERHAATAVRELAPWIERRISAVQESRAMVARREGTLPFLGQTLELLGEPGRTRVTRRGDILKVPADPVLQRRGLESWFRGRARVEVGARLDAACAQAGLAYTGLTIRAQKTRWASCSSAGMMSFNWRLLLAPPEILGYVVWHEVCHLEVMDHSPRFWALLAEHRPGYGPERAWLRRYGATLVL